MYVQINGVDVVVDSAFTDTPTRHALNSSLFQNWVKSLDPTIRVKSIFLESATAYGNAIGNMKLTVHAENSRGEALPGSVFLRGCAVAVLVVVESDGQEYLLLTQQTRLATGNTRLLEIPAGMCNDKDPLAQAVQELKEEVGLEVRPQELMPLHADERYRPLPLYLSPGGCDEQIYLFLHVMQLRSHMFERWRAQLQGKLNGLAEEGEYIEPIFLPVSEAPRKLRDTKSLLAYSLYKLTKQTDSIESDAPNPFYVMNR